MAVSSIYDRRIGTVAAVRNDAFAVRLDDGAVVWLKNDCLFTVRAGGVTLVCSAARVGEYQA